MLARTSSDARRRWSKGKMSCSNTKVGVGRVVKILLDVVKRPGNPKAQDVSLFVVQRLQEGPMSSLASFKPSHCEVYKEPQNHGWNTEQRGCLAVNAEMKTIRDRCVRWLTQVSSE